MMIQKPIESRTIGNLLIARTERIIVPRYQRRFSWNQSHFKDLWIDLDRIIIDDRHFFGTMVFMSRAYIAQGINEVEVVDGQQRITTVFIFLCAIRDFLKQNFEDKVRSRINKIDESLWLIDLDGKKQGMRLILGNLDKKCFENVVNSNIEDIKNNHIKEAYEYFYQQLENLNDLEKIKSIHQKILDKLLYVSITLNSHADAFRLFEAMNNRGLSLSPIDLIKNYLLMKTSEREDIDDEKIENLWGDIIQNLDMLDISNPITTFFRQYFMSTPLLEINEKVSKNKLYEPYFTAAIDKLTNAEDFIEFIRDIKKQSGLYQEMLTQNINRFNYSKNSEINNLLRDAKIISITQFTLFLRAFQELENDTKKIKEVIRKSIALLIRRQICDRGTGSHDTYFNHLAQNAFKKVKAGKSLEKFVSKEEKEPLKYIDKYLSSENRFPNDDEFKKRFNEQYFAKNDSTKYVLGIIEENYFGHGGKKVKESRYEVHIEHILPELYCQSLKENWLEPLGISKDEHEAYKKRIGNLTLLEQGPNISASNRTFKEKQKYYTQEKTDFEITHLLLDYSNWGLQQIKNRGKNLADIACKIWKL